MTSYESSAPAAPAKRSSVLEEILSSGRVTDGHTTYELLAHVGRIEGQFLADLVTELRPAVSLEIGLAYGVSTLFICETLRRLGIAARHIVIDPFQRATWHDVGLRNVREAGFAELVEFHEEASEIALPRLLAQGTRIRFALIDGGHTFDQVLVDFYYVNRMLDVGGVVVFDDRHLPAVNRVVRHVLTYPAYQFHANTSGREYRSSLFGRVRRAVRDFAPVSRFVRHDVLVPDWEIGLADRCVAVKKVAVDERMWDWHRDF